MPSCRLRHPASSVPPLLPERRFPGFHPSRYNPATVALDKSLDASDKISLEFFHICHSFLFHPLPAVHALTPGLHGGFIAADMDERGGEDVHHFLQNCFQKPEGGLIPRAQVPGTRVETAVRMLAQHFGVGITHFHGVAGHLYLRNDGDESFGSIGYQFLQVLFCIIAAISFRVICGGEAVVTGLPFVVGITFPEGGFSGQIRIGLALNAPAREITRFYFYYQIVEILISVVFDTEFHRMLDRLAEDADSRRWFPAGVPPAPATAPASFARGIPPPA